MRTSVTTIMLLMLVLASGCSRGPKPIDFGNELCHFCKMTISDPKFGAEIITTTGKAYKYDAAECMIWQMEEGSIPADKVHQQYVIAYDDPTNLIEVNKAHFLIAEKQPSPMGAYLSVYASDETAEKAAQSTGGKLYSWDKVQSQIEKN